MTPFPWSSLRQPFFENAPWFSGAQRPSRTQRQEVNPYGRLVQLMVYQPQRAQPMGRIWMLPQQNDDEDDKCFQKRMELHAERFRLMEMQKKDVDQRRPWVAAERALLEKQQGLKEATDHRFHELQTLSTKIESMFATCQESAPFPRPQDWPKPPTQQEDLMCFHHRLELYLERLADAESECLAELCRRRDFHLRVLDVACQSVRITLSRELQTLIVEMATPAAWAAEQSSVESRDGSPAF